MKICRFGKGKTLSAYKNFMKSLPRDCKKCGYRKYYDAWCIYSEMKCYHKSLAADEKRPINKFKMFIRKVFEKRREKWI